VEKELSFTIFSRIGSFPNYPQKTLGQV